MVSLMLGSAFVGIRLGNAFIRIGWSGFMFIFFMVCLLAMVYSVFAAGRQLKTIFSKNPAGLKQKNDDIENLQRRWFLKRSVNSTITAASSALVFRGVFNGFKEPCVNLVTVPIHHSHDYLNPVNIVQISDLHLDLAASSGWVKSIVDTVNSLYPDLIVITGDLVDANVQDLRNIAAPLADLHAPHGRFFVTGNHEYYIGAGGADHWLEELDRIGFRILENEHHVLTHGKGKLIIAGVPDFEIINTRPTRFPDPMKAIDNAPAQAYKILLAHQPKLVYEAQKAGVDLQISGHTHGGQIFPGHLFMGLSQPFIAGLHQLDQTRIYVSRGTGYWGPPMRLNAPSEITLLQLRYGNGSQATAKDAPAAIYS